LTRRSDIPEEHRPLSYGSLQSPERQHAQPLAFSPVSTSQFSTITLTWHGHSVTVMTAPWDTSETVRERICQAIDEEHSVPSIRPYLKVAR
jgi:hypothetical protein